MAPKRVVNRYVGFVDRHRNAILATLLVISVILALLAAGGWVSARNAQSRVNRIEVERKAEQVAKETGEVALCFSTARNRPRVVAIFDALVNELADTSAQKALRDLVSEYNAGTRSRVDCVAIARRYGIDFRPYDFNPKTGQPVAR